LAVFTALPIFLPLAMAANFEFHINDARGDVGNADIDIIQAGSNIKGSNLVFYMKVAGNINNEYAYWITATNGDEEVGAAYSQGDAFYVSGTSVGKPEYNISGDTISIELPLGIFSDWQHFSFQAFAGKSYMGEGQEFDYTSEIGDTGGNGGNGGNDGNENNTNNANDPTKGEATDKSIDVSITDVSYTVSKENANSVSGSVMVKGTTNGVDHVSLCFVVYYKNGTYDYGSWIVGPSEFHQSFGGYSINEFFNSTGGNWNKWEFNISGTYPMSNYNWVYDMFKGESKVSKVVIYARAFKDAQETKWNQCHYDTIPSFSTKNISYKTASEQEGKGNSKTPGFEFVLVAIAIGTLLIIEKRRK